MLHTHRTLGIVIRDRRIELGLTQEELAERIGDGVRQSDVSRLERDRIQLPRPQRLRAIARALDMEPGELLVASGWEGIAGDQAGPAPGADREPAGEPVFELAESYERWPTPNGEAVDDDPLHERLQQAMEHSREVRARTEETMERAQETARSWHRHYGSSPPQPKPPSSAESEDA